MRAFVFLVALATVHVCTARMSDDKKLREMIDILKWMREGEVYEELSSIERADKEESVRAQNSPTRLSKELQATDGDVGQHAVQHSIVDTTKFWTFVDNQVFPQAGNVKSITLHSGADGRPLRVGVYRPVDSAVCQYELIQQVILKSVPIGIETISLAESDWLAVEAGDHFGFTWTNYGVVTFDRTVTDNYCEKEIVPNVGDIVKLNSDYGGREYSIMAHVSPPDVYVDVGHPVVERAILDISGYWTYVDNQAFTQAGYVTSIVLYAGADGSPLRVGVYRPVDSAACNYKLIQQVILQSVPQGMQTICLAESDWLSVEAGDHLGFTWTNYGVVTFEHANTDNYCEKEIIPNVGDTVELNSDVGRRIYSIMAHESLPLVSEDVGYDEQERELLDIQVEWTYVDNQAFTQAGYIKSVSLYAGQDGRPLSVGVYRPASSAACDYELMDQVVLPSVAQGMQTISLEQSDWLAVEPGDHLGFTWTNYGVVYFDNSPTYNYCEKRVTPNIGDTIQMDGARFGNRIYSIMAHVSNGSAEPNSCDI